jgi:hypothetical protein
VATGRLRSFRIQVSACFCLDNEPLTTRTAAATVLLSLSWSVNDWQGIRKAFAAPPITVSPGDPSRCSVSITLLQGESSALAAANG